MGWSTRWGQPTVQTGTVIVILLHFSKPIVLCTKLLPPRLLFLPLASRALKMMTRLRRGAQPLLVGLTTERDRLLKAPWHSGSARHSFLKFAQ